MEVRIRHIQGKQFEASARGHRVLCDQPTDNHGDDAGMTQPELFLAALGACSAHYAAEYLQARNLPLLGLDIRVTGEKGGQPVRLTEIGIMVDAPGIDAQHQRGLLRAVEACLLHRALLNPPRIRITLAGREPVVSYS